MSTETVGEMLRRYHSMGLFLIPLKIGGKRPAEDAWNTIVNRGLQTQLLRFEGHLDRTIENYVDTQGNFGVLNGPSNTITLDCDSELAAKALAAAGVKVAELWEQPTAWESIKGGKVLFRPKPGRTKLDERVVFKIWDEKTGAYQVVFELRGSGQDVLPPSYRSDAGRNLRWLHGEPEKIPMIPSALVEVYKQLKAGHGPLIDRMMKAVGATPRPADHYALSGYPTALSAFVTERAFVNSRYEVPALLEQCGYRQIGSRWLPEGATSAPGIIPPRSGHDEHWLCEHEGDVLAGVFDAWRIIVEHEYAGDIAGAVAAVRAEMNERKKAPDAPEKPGEPVPVAPDVVIDGEVDDVFLTGPMVPRLPILDGVFPLKSGFNMMVASPKSGKSTLTTAMALCAATGVSMSSFKVAAPMPVLYCSFDESVEHNLRPRIRLLVEALKLPMDLVRKNLRIIERPAALVEVAEMHDDVLPFEAPVDDDNPVGATHNVLTRGLYWYLRHFNVRLCVVDTMTRLRLPTKGLSNPYERDIRDVAAFNDVFLNADCCGIGVHHTNKASEKNAHLSMLSHVSGTQGMAGSVQSIVAITPYRGTDSQVTYEIEPRGAKALIEMTGRDQRSVGKQAFSMTETQLADHADPALLWKHMGDAEVLSNTDLKQACCEYLYDQPADEYVTTETIIAALVQAGTLVTRNAASFRQIPHRMVRLGMMESRKGPGGGWRLTKTYREAIRKARIAKGY